VDLLPFSFSSTIADSNVDENLKSLARELLSALCPTGLRDVSGPQL
jgi:hypothetical protein